MIILLAVDWTTETVMFHRSNGMIGTAQLPSPIASQPTRIAKTTWSPPLHSVLIETSEGDEVAVELHRFDRADQLQNRLVGYLDQCIWRRMTDAMHNPAALDDGEREAAQELIRLVSERKVILPLSSGHHSETTQWSNNNARRYQLGLTTLRLSRGWEMRDPLVVRRHEFRTGLLRNINANRYAANRRRSL